MVVLNKDKTFCLQFNFSKQILNKRPLIWLDGKSVTHVNSFKFLGLYIDNSLNWKHHVEVLHKKCAGYAYAVKRLIKICSCEVAKTFYYSNFESRIRYGIIFWGGSSVAHRIFLLQKRIVRNIFGLDYTESCRPTFIKNNMLTLCSLYIYELLKFVKINVTEFNTLNYFHEYNTRHGDHIAYKNHNLTKYESNPYYLCGCCSVQ